MEREITMDQFPSPLELWQRYLLWKGIAPEAEPVYAQDYYPGKPARYYQLNAVNRAIEAVTKGQSRILLGIATGTGKTHTAFRSGFRCVRSRNPHLAFVLLVS